MKNLPREGELVKRKDIKGKVVNVNALKRTVTVETEDGRQVEFLWNNPAGDKDGEKQSING